MFVPGCCTHTGTFSNSCLLGRDANYLFFFVKVGETMGVSILQPLEYTRSRKLNGWIFL